jgi:hypothetical protein
MDRPSPLLELLERSVGGLDYCVQALGTSFPAPVRVAQGNRFVFRHMQHDDLLLSYLKLVKIASHHNAAMILLRAGYVHEVYALCRMIDEACEDVLFMATPLGEGGQESDDQRKFIEEFFQEEFGNSDDPLGSLQGRDRVSRRRIHAALSKLPTKDGDPSTGQAVARTLYQAFSGFVHGAYVHIMELFGGNPARFHTRGMLNTPRMAECETNHVNYLLRSLFMVELVARRAIRADITDKALALSTELARQTGCLKADGVASAEARRARGRIPPS